MRTEAYNAQMFRHSVKSHNKQETNEQMKQNKVSWGGANRLGRINVRITPAVIVS